MKSDHVERLKTALALGYPPQDILRIIGEGNVAMLEDYQARIQMFLDLQEAQRESLDEIRVAIRRFEMSASERILIAIMVLVSSAQTAWMLHISNTVESLLK